MTISESKSAFIRAYGESGMQGFDIYARPILTLLQSNEEELPGLIVEFKHLIRHDFHNIVMTHSLPLISKHMRHIPGIENETAAILNPDVQSEIVAAVGHFADEAGNGFVAYMNTLRSNDKQISEIERVSIYEATKESLFWITHPYYLLQMTAKRIKNEITTNMYIPESGLPDENYAEQSKKKTQVLLLITDLQKRMHEESKLVDISIQ